VTRKKGDGPGQSWGGKKKKTATETGVTKKKKKRKKGRRPIKKGEKKGIRPVYLVFLGDLTKEKKERKDPAAEPSRRGREGLEKKGGRNGSAM